MTDLNRHKFLLVQILKDIYSDIELASWLGFKGGTAMMFFYDLPRFSVDLDFNLLNAEKEEIVFEKLQAILLKYGTISDKAIKFYGSVVVLNYGTGERKLKVETSNRLFDNHYEIKNLLGINVKVMVQPDLFAHKLCALLDRNELANRDLFDCWYFMQKRTPINKDLVEFRMGISLNDYLQKCVDRLEALSDKGLLQGIGDLTDSEMKNFVKTKLRTETIGLFRLYKDLPITI
jgi:predicted nucleotidyltransferase component of viral defense system